MMESGQGTDDTIRIDCSVRSESEMDRDQVRYLSRIARRRKSQVAERALHRARKRLRRGQGAGHTRSREIRGAPGRRTGSRRSSNGTRGSPDDDSGGESDPSDLAAGLVSLNEVELEELLEAAPVVVFVFLEGDGDGK